MSPAEFFEGAEKLLEIVFDAELSKNADLRLIPRSEIVELLKIIKCEIISEMRNENIDAYVLSESSLFVSKQRVVIKTCGTTTLLLALDRLLRLAKAYANFSRVIDLYYSRKNFLKENLQLKPHQNFEQEKEFLDKILQASNRRDYVFQPHFNSYSDKLTKGDTIDSAWFLYTLNSPLLLNDYIDCNVFATVCCAAPTSKEIFEHDQTLEILMSDLNPEVMAIFSRANSKNAIDARRKIGIDQIIPDMTIDDFLFDPCGYSMNGINKKGYYMTIHITPEPEYSYVSFETNFPAVNYKDLVDFVTDLFHPKRFTVTIFAGHQSATRKNLHEFECRNSKTLFGKFPNKTVQHRRMKNYDFLYACYSKFPS